MDLSTFIWPRSRPDHSQRGAAGRVMHVALVVIGSMGVVIELLDWHGRWDHLAIYTLMWIGSACVGRSLRLWLSRE